MKRKLTPRLFKMSLRRNTSHPSQYDLPNHTERPISASSAAPKSSLKPVWPAFRSWVLKPFKTRGWPLNPGKTDQTAEWWNEAMTRFALAYGTGKKDGMQNPQRPACSGWAGILNLAKTLPAASPRHNSLSFLVQSRFYLPAAACFL